MKKIIMFLIVLSGFMSMLNAQALLRSSPSLKRTLYGYTLGTSFSNLVFTGNYKKDMESSKHWGNVLLNDVDNKYVKYVNLIFYDRQLYSIHTIYSINDNDSMDEFCGFHGKICDYYNAIYGPACINDGTLKWNDGKTILSINAEPSESGVFAIVYEDFEIYKRVSQEVLKEFDKNCNVILLQEK
ncbi:MAG: hypothetical protein A2252_08040 [Elusimicrobia bacterium RIFOXYA2_FULL_39_19]|nr:MAG: hypothetical protein A2252_08040 [Elusimicrobia bacterium RIFOXYA2_FULL_39_19]